MKVQRGDVVTSVIGKLSAAMLGTLNDCLKAAQRLSTPQTRRTTVVLARHRRFHPPAPMSFALFLTPPRAPERP